MVLKELTECRFFFKKHWFYPLRWQLLHIICYTIFSIFSPMCNNTRCKLELDVYPVVPTISAQQTQFNPGTYGLSGITQTPIAPTYGYCGGYLNQSFTDSEQSSSSCVLENPDNIDLPLHQPPYLLSTYVWKIKIIYITITSSLCSKVNYLQKKVLT